ncbi:MAG: 4'-phosphopantetheinyl transferase superfamily protein [Lentisphaerae bacterium]|nr:4'-phosphopantetheinyl transferase superfamily protein [Lentisphaerota bacterium]
MNPPTSPTWQDWSLPGEPFRLSAVEVGGVDWDQHLPQDACDRLARFRDSQARARAGASEWLKACWLPEQLGVDQVDMRPGPNGKPMLSDGLSSWGFNLSHAGAYAVAGLVPEGAIGVDLESSTRKADIHRLARRVFSGPEQQRVREGGREAFFLLWSLKEALLKALGCGWADGAVQQQTRLLPVAWQKEPSTGAELWSRQILGGTYVLSVALLRR